LPQHKLMYGADCHWHLHLPFVQYAYNNKVQSLTGATPFSLMFGRAANSPTDYELNEQGLLQDAEIWKKHQEEVFSLIFPAISERRGREQSKVRSRVDRLRRNIIDESLPAGTVVYIKDPEYAVDGSKKPSTAPNYVGPYTVVRRSAHGPYILNDDRGIKLNRPVPLDQMKVLYTPEDKPDGADELDDPANSYEVERILGHKTREEDGVQLFHAKWKGYPESEASWLPLSRFNDTKIVTDYLASVNGLRRSPRTQPSSSSIDLSTPDMDLDLDYPSVTDPRSGFIHPSRRKRFSEFSDE